VIKQHRESLGRLLKLATSDSVISWPVGAAVALSSVAIHLFGSPDLANDDLGLRILISAVCTLPVMVLIAIGLYIAPSSAVPRSLWLVTFYAAGGLLRGWTLSSLLNIFDLTETSSVVFRSSASLIMLPITLSIATVGWQTYLNHQGLLASLHQESENLQSVLCALQQASSVEAESRITSIVSGLNTQLNRVRLQPVANQVAHIERVIETQVRPMSRQLAEEIEVWKPPSQLPTVIKFADVWRQQDPLNHLPRPWMALPLATATLSLSTYRFGWAVAVEIFIGTLLTIGAVLKFGNPLIAHLLRNRSTPWREIGISVALLCQSIPAALVSIGILSDTEAPFTYVLGALIIIPLFGWMVILSSTFWAQAQARERDFHLLNQELRWVIARLGVITWFHRGVLSRLLHGPIQNSLHATLIRLRDTEQKETVEAVITDLEDRLSQAEQYEPRNSLEQLSETWYGIARIEFDISARAERVIERDRAVATIATDLCHELASNAIRHGQASQLKIVLDAKGRSLQLSVTDNGMEWKNSAPPGVGTKMLDECCVHWETGRLANVNQLQTQLPTVESSDGCRT